MLKEFTRTEGEGWACAARPPNPAGIQSGLPRTFSLEWPEVGTPHYYPYFWLATATVFYVAGGTQIE